MKPETRKRPCRIAPAGLFLFSLRQKALIFCFVTCFVQKVAEKRIIKASLYWLGLDTAAIETAYPQFDENFKYAEYTLDANINTRTTSDQLTMTQIDYFYSKGEGSNADLCKGTRTSFEGGAALSSISKSQGAAINYMSIPSLFNSGGHAVDETLEVLFDEAEKSGAKFTLPATNKVKLYASPYADTLGEVIYDFGLDGSGQYIITIQFHSQKLYLEDAE